MRGNRLDHVREHVLVRSIPACAGEPLICCRPGMFSTVYPRVCGGTVPYAEYVKGVLGLSPRVRGNPPGQRCSTTTFGSIPACAGEPSPAGAPSISGRVYPRVCGGTLVLVQLLRWNEGLSPRVRGNPGVPRLSRQMAGSIPACAGEPASATEIANSCSVYPRVCGGTPCFAAAPLTGVGLSPRVRGNPHKGIQSRPAERSIPACAGEPIRSG